MLLARIRVGGVPIGGGSPVVVQSMTLTETSDVEATLDQIRRLADAGCELARVAVPGRADADALPALVAGSPLPVIADIHFNASLALRAIDAGVAAVRINPGNIGGPDKVEQVVSRAKAAGIPMRIGANSGSLPDHLRQFATNDPAGALVEAALEEVRLLERLDYRDFKISVKSSSVPVMIQAYRRLAEQVPYPLHLGVTEAGPAFTGTVKSAIGMGSLLVDGIGDTMRVSLTADPVEEVKVAWEILRVLGLRHKGPVMIACPSCGRTNVDVLDLAERGRGAAGRLRRGVRGGGDGLRRERARGGRRRRLRHRRRQGRRLHLRPRRGAAQGDPARAGGRALPRDRRLDRRRHGAAAAKDAQARAAGGAGGG